VTCERGFIRSVQGVVRLGGQVRDKSVLISLASKSDLYLSTAMDSYTTKREKSTRVDPDPDDTHYHEKQTLEKLNQPGTEET
jgi:hypothetical protein